MPWAQPCTAHRRDGETCGAYAIRGGRVCRMRSTDRGAGSGVARFPEWPRTPRRSSGCRAASEGRPRPSAGRRGPWRSRRPVVLQGRVGHVASLSAPVVGRPSTTALRLLSLARADRRPTPTADCLAARGCRGARVRRPQNRHQLRPTREAREDLPDRADQAVADIRHGPSARSRPARGRAPRPAARWSGSRCVRGAPRTRATHAPGCRRWAGCGRAGGRQQGAGEPAQPGQRVGARTRSRR